MAIEPARTDQDVREHVPSLGAPAVAQLRIVANIGPLPVNPQEIHMVLAVLGDDLPGLFEE